MFSEGQLLINSWVEGFVRLPSARRQSTQPPLPHSLKKEVELVVQVVESPCIGTSHVKVTNQAHANPAQDITVVVLFLLIVEKVVS